MTKQMRTLMSMICVAPCTAFASLPAFAETSEQKAPAALVKPADPQKLEQAAESVAPKVVEAAPKADPVQAKPTTTAPITAKASNEAPAQKEIAASVPEVSEEKAPAIKSDAKTAEIAKPAPDASTLAVADTETAPQTATEDAAPKAIAETTAEEAPTDAPIKAAQAEEKASPVVKVSYELPKLKIFTAPLYDQTADQDVTDALQAALKAIPATKNFHLKRDNAAIQSFYKGRAFQPAWYDNGQLTANARKLIFTLSRADLDGLNPADYITPALSIGRTNGSSADAIAKADVTLSLAITKYTRHAYAGRIDPRRISKKDISIKPHLPDSIKILEEITLAGNPKAKLLSYNPQHKGYQALRAKYNELRLKKADKKTAPIPAGKSMKVGKHDKRVPQLYAKLGLVAPTGTDSKPTLYTKELAKQVKAFQKANGLIADGIVGKGTLAVLNGNRGDLIANMVANMERWRWLPRKLGDFHVMVNIPTFHVQVVKDDKKIHQTRVVVGKKANKTPIFSDTMEYLVVNPYWNVPRSIASKELLPKIRTNPAEFFSSKNYQVLASVKGRTRVIDPSQLDWSKVEASQVRLRQPPGTRNALGRIKFMFPNKHAVYLHDTPSRSLFKRDYRAYSHGCVRVHKPFEFADFILKQEKSWNAARVKKMVGGSEKRINLKRKIPVHLAYFTTWMSEEGTLQVRSDIYGHNAKVKKLLGL
ncbi:MAG: L,D-transpeptidase family protein [Cohaesibacter sp.]|jgi:murein L,D-transpeptidase YcbB/YkuD|nr:L,D-transpeptidase family protein [Cohaesibacter sp.]